MLTTADVMLHGARGSWITNCYPSMLCSTFTHFVKCFLGSRPMMCAILLYQRPSTYMLLVFPLPGPFSGASHASYSLPHVPKTM